MVIFLSLFVAAFFWPLFWPHADIAVSGLFYDPARGFFLASTPVFLALHWLAYYGARALGVIFAACAACAYARGRPFAKLEWRGWLFLLTALLVGPVLIANVGLKDHWGRFRPREVIEFAGTEPFTPALSPHFERGHSNGSFVSGDGAFGFFLPSFAYVVPRRRTRITFWAAFALGGLFGFARLAMGAHFLSDILCACVFMLAASAGVHPLFYGWSETKARWRLWLTSPSKP